MAQSCTMFSVSDAELQPASDLTLPTYDESSKMLRPDVPHTLELGASWAALHAALGNHGADHPLGFMADGGERFAALDDGARSSGRYFKGPQVVKLLTAVAKVYEDEVAKELLRPLQRVRRFLAEAVDTERGIIVHLFG